MITLTFKVWDGNGNLTDADSVPTLTEKTGTYGIKRNDSGAIVVAANTAMTKSATGIYTYEFSPPVTLIQYTAWIRVVYKRKISYREVLFIPPAESLTYSTPATIMWNYLVNVAELFTNPSAGSDWALFDDFLPDDVNIVSDNIAAIFTTPGILHGKDIDGTQYQHYGLQLRVRAFDFNGAYEKVKNVITALLTVYNQNVNVSGDATYKIHNITQTSDIVKIDYDEKDRTHYVVNFITAYTRM
jgi:hypothetical protein